MAKKGNKRLKREKDSNFQSNVNTPKILTLKKLQDLIKKIPKNHKVEVFIKEEDPYKARRVECLEYSHYGKLGTLYIHLL